MSNAFIKKAISSLLNDEEQQVTATALIKSVVKHAGFDALSNRNLVDELVRVAGRENALIPSIESGGSKVIVAKRIGLIRALTKSSLEDARTDVMEQERIRVEAEELALIGVRLHVEKHALLCQTPPPKRQRIRATVEDPFGEPCDVPVVEGGLSASEFLTSTRNGDLEQVVEHALKLSAAGASHKSLFWGALDLRPKPTLVAAENDRASDLCAPEVLSTLTEHYFQILQEASNTLSESAVNFLTVMRTLLAAEMGSRCHVDTLGQVLAVNGAIGLKTHLLEIIKEFQTASSETDYCEDLAALVQSIDSTDKHFQYICFQFLDRGNGASQADGDDKKLRQSHAKTGKKVDYLFLVNILKIYLQLYRCNTFVTLTAISPQRNGIELGVGENSAGGEVYGKQGKRAVEAHVAENSSTSARYCGETDLDGPLFQF
ncbi:hypothetical protein HDU86_002335 [Geranomyces michiganensis]|nr:hypothetical protein HDU86_002335 [Geranomyces michiganensis]